MKRAPAIAGALVVTILVFGGFIAIRILSRFLRSIVWFVETIALFGLAVVFGYIAYRVLWGDTDDPRRH